MNKTTKLIISALVISFALSTTATATDWGDWNSCSNLQLSEGLDDYQYRLTIPDTSGIDKSSIRISDSPCGDDGERVPHWVEEWSSEGKIWFRSSGTSTDYAIYYDNPGASDVSSGEETFHFFDDFTEDTYTNKWEEVENTDDMGDVWIEDEKVVLKQWEPMYKYITIDTIDDFSIDIDSNRGARLDYWVNTNYKGPGQFCRTQSPRGYLLDSDDEENRARMRYHAWTGSIRLRAASVAELMGYTEDQKDVIHAEPIIEVFSDHVYGRWPEIYNTGGSLRDYEEIISSGAFSGTDEMKVRLSMRMGGVEDCWNAVEFDDVRVRSIKYPEPKVIFDHEDLEVTTNEAEEITENSAELHGEIEDLGILGEADLYFQIRPKGNTNWVNFYVDTTSTPKSFDYGVTNLQPNEEYEYRAVANKTYDDTEIRSTGEIEEFRTIGIYEGKIDDIKTYDRELSESEIEDLADEKYTDEVENGMLFWWPLNQREGDIAYDETDNDNHGYFIGEAYNWMEIIKR